MVPPVVPDPVVDLRLRKHAGVRVLNLLAFLDRPRRQGWNDTRVVKIIQQSGPIELLYHHKLK